MPQEISRMSYYVTFFNVMITWNYTFFPIWRLKMKGLKTDTRDTLKYAIALTEYYIYKVFYWQNGFISQKSSVKTRDRKNVLSKTSITSNICDIPRILKVPHNSRLQGLISFFWYASKRWLSFFGITYVVVLLHNYSLFMVNSNDMEHNVHMWYFARFGSICAI